MGDTKITRKRLSKDDHEKLVKTVQSLCEKGCRREVMVALKVASMNQIDHILSGAFERGVVSSQMAVKYCTMDKSVQDLFPCTDADKPCFVKIEAHNAGEYLVYVLSEMTLREELGLMEGNLPCK